MRPDVGGYLESWSQELKARQDRVRQLIGDAHWLIEGQHKEAIIREFLARYLPLHLIVSRGFIRPPTSHRCSPEVDILISDPMLHPPFFNEGGVAIIPASAALAYFEVKTAFSRSNLRKALDSVSVTQRAIARTIDSQPVWRCVCFFDQSPQFDFEETAGMISEELQVIRGNRVSEEAVHQSEEYFPTCIVVASRFVAFLRRANEPDYCVLRLFPAEEYSLACAFSDMFSSINWRLTGVSTNELEQMIESIQMDSPIVITVK